MKLFHASVLLTLLHQVSHSSAFIRQVSQNIIVKSNVQTSNQIRNTYLNMMYGTSHTQSEDILSSLNIDHRDALVKLAMHVRTELSEHPECIHHIAAKDLKEGKIDIEVIHCSDGSCVALDIPVALPSSMYIYSVPELITTINHIVEAEQGQELDGSAQVYLIDSDVNVVSTAYTLAPGSLNTDNDGVVSRFLALLQDNDFSEDIKAIAANYLNKNPGAALGTNIAAARVVAVSETGLHIDVFMDLGGGMTVPHAIFVPFRCRCVDASSYEREIMSLLSA